MLDRPRQTLRFALSGPAGDIRHAERTAAILRSLGADDELVAAGLLHDAAKPAETRLWHRVAGVVLRAVAPGLCARLSRGESTLARYLDHPRRGAEAARRQGASERIAGLIARHHERPRSADERLLARADREALP